MTFLKRVFKPLITSIFAFLLMPFDPLLATTTFPQYVPVPLTNISPNFFLDLIQSNFQILENTFNNPENSFNIITNPEERLQFLQTMSSTLNNIQTSLQIAIQQFNLDLDGSIVSIINNEITTMNDAIANRVSGFLLPLNISSLEINSDFIVNRFNQNDINTFVDTQERFIIQLPIILQQLNQSLYDLSVQIDTSDSYITSDILASYNILLMKLSDLQNNLFSVVSEITFKINSNICSDVNNCNLVCRVLDKISGQWIDYPTVNLDSNLVLCKISSLQVNRLYSTGLTTIGVGDSEFLPIGVFNKNEKSSGLSTNFIIFISITSFICLIILGFVIKKCINKKKFGLVNTVRYSPSYQAV